MDNLSVHKNSFDTKKFSSRTIEIKYLPPDSKNLNPIERMWSKIKTKIKEYQATDRDTFFEAIKKAFETITASNAEVRLKSCRYFQ